MRGTLRTYARHRKSAPGGRGNRLARAGRVRKARKTRVLLNRRTDND
ncbi:hypothetical protein [Actinomadura violacea]|uniref:50S ribosomal protein L34 n=1 Tax=Actinomadura violacea TaxID=2819934 RepID=A0ABS3RXS4_9ACTN|nr:hypothetical protein [Actinomadura violacea]MBO2461564.1 hypothetical protein [Actinomadura violacea]